jgi:hypothetical protein
MRENIVKFGGELGATLEVYIATFCIFLQLFSNFSHFTQQLFAFYVATFQKFTSTIGQCLMAGA